MSAALREDDVMRYYDSRFKVTAAKLLPTQYLVVDNDTALVTVLGSCVAACIRDPLLKLGGMNHFLLPDGNVGDGAPARYGSYAMELLINDLLKRGANRKRLEAKVFGGANVLKGFTSNPVGTRNAEFVRQYLQADHRCVQRGFLLFAHGDVRRDPDRSQGNTLLVPLDNLSARMEPPQGIIQTVDPVLQVQRLASTAHQRGLHGRGNSLSVRRVDA